RMKLQTIRYRRAEDIPVIVSEAKDSARQSRNETRRHSEPAERGEESQVTRPEILRRLRGSEAAKKSPNATPILLYREEDRLKPVPTVGLIVAFARCGDGLQPVPVTLS